MNGIKLTTLSLLSLGLFVSYMPVQAVVKTTKSKASQQSVTEVKSAADFDKLISQNNRVIVDFHAINCSACKTMDPIFKELAGKNPDVTFAKVNIKTLTPLAQKYSVRSTPTFILFKDGKKIKSIAGQGEKHELQTLIDELNK